MSSIWAVLQHAASGRPGRRGSLLKRRAIRHGAAALLLAIPLAGALQALHANAAVTLYYPDLQMVVPTESIQIYHPVGMPKELRFTHITSNLGDGPLEIHPVYDPVSQTAVGQQNLYSRDSTGKWYVASTTPIGGTFVWDPAHGHYHWPLASYGLYTVASNGSVGTPVVMSPKVGFCIAEDYAVNLELPNAPQSIVYDGNTCIDPTAIRGISVGWGDQYGWMDPGESIDITNVADGVYWFRSMVDPNSYLLEKDKTNNTRDIKLQIAGDTVKLLNPLPSTGGFTFDQSFLQEGTGTVSTPTFTAAAGATLMALVASDGTSVVRQTVTVSGLGLNWTLAARSNTQNGMADVWSASAANQVTGMVTSTQTTAGLDQTLTVLSVLGAGGIGSTAAANAGSGGPAVSLTTTRAGSWVIGVGNDPNHQTFRAIGPNQTMVNEWVDFQCIRPGSTTCSLWTQATSAPIPAAGTMVQLNDAYPTTDYWNFAAVELMVPLQAPGAPSGISATAGDAKAAASWTAPTSDGGSPITGYRVTPYIGATAQTATTFTSTATSQTISGLTNGTTYTFTVAAINTVGRGPESTASNAVTPLPAPFSALSTQQYSLANGDGSTWVDLDATNLKLTITPTFNAQAILNANSDLWTANAGYNQDLGIDVNGTIQAWKESGGFAGTFSPNAAFVQTVMPMTAGTTYVIKLRWKTNKPAAGATIHAGAGSSAPFSPTSLTAQLVASGVSSAVSSQQYTLANSNGSSWADLDATNLKLTITPTVNAVAILSGNADLFTANAGYNQDLGIDVNGTIQAWKESGGFAGTFSPNAAFVQTVMPMTAGTTYVIKLRWKTNRAAPGATIYAGAGPIGTQFSPTGLSALILPS